VAQFVRARRRQGDSKSSCVGTVVAIGGREDSPEIFHAFTSPLSQTTVFVYDPRTKKSTPFEATDSAIDVSRYETQQFFAISKDGTRVPFFLTARKDLPRDGD